MHGIEQWADCLLVKGRILKMFGILQCLNPPTAQVFLGRQKKRGQYGSLPTDLATGPPKEPPPLAGGRGGLVGLLRTATKGRKPQENQRQG